MKTLNAQYPIILEDTEFQPDAYLYVRTASLGTYIGNVVSLNTPYSSEGGVTPSIFIPANELHPKNADCPISVIVTGISINDVSEGQNLNMLPGNLALGYSLGKLAVTKDVQPSNIEEPILSRLLGSTIDFRDVHPANTSFDNTLILGINVILFKLEQR